VERVAVDLDHETLARPEHVDLVPGHPYVGTGGRKAGGTDQLEQPSLGL